MGQCLSRPGRSVLPDLGVSRGAGDSPGVPRQLLVRSLPYTQQSPLGTVLTLFSPLCRLAECGCCSLFFLQVIPAVVINVSLAAGTCLTWPSCPSSSRTSSPDGCTRFGLWRHGTTPFAVPPPALWTFSPSARFRRCVSAMQPSLSVVCRHSILHRDLLLHVEEVWADGLDRV